MKNKLIINIVLVYFVLLAIVLAVQLKLTGNRDITTEPLKDNTTYGDILSDSIVLHYQSPVMLVNQKQLLVNGDNTAAVPFEYDGNTMVPIEFFKETYGAAISSNIKMDNATVRLNNKALVVEGGKKVTLVSAFGEQKLNSDSNIVFTRGTAYISLESFAEGFDKSLDVYEGIILLSDKGHELEEEQVKEFVSQIEPKVNNLPTVAEKEKLEELLGSGAVNIFNAFGDKKLFQKESPVSTLGLDATGVDSPAEVKTDDEYIYFLRDKSINIARLGEKPETVGQIKSELTSIEGIYVYGNYLSLVGTGSAITEDSNFKGTTVLVYDITDRTKPFVVRQVGIEGEYSNAYRKDDILYLFAKKEAESADSESIPVFYDSANKDISKRKTLGDITYVPEMSDKSYTGILAFNLGDMGRAVITNIILGCGDDYSLTGESLYIPATSQGCTSVYKLALNEGSLDYRTVGYSIKPIPHSACINELNGVVRIASYDETGADVRVYNDKMDDIDILSRINLSGEMVSARFIGARGYLVSDNKQESLYAVDLTEKPVDMGKIKIPENTVAVRNYDADHFICIKDNGQLSILNIADINNQVEFFVTDIGGEFNNIDDIVLNTEENIFALPANIYNINAETTAVNVAETVTEQVSLENTTLTEVTTELSTDISEVSGEVIDVVDNTDPWSGVLVYKVDINNSLVPIAKISHTDDGYVGDSVITAITYKDSRIYTISDNEVKSTYVK